MLEIEWLSFITGFSVATGLFVSYGITHFLSNFYEDNKGE